MSWEDVAVPAGSRVEGPRGTGIGNASAVPALEKRSARGAQGTRGVMRARDQSPRLRVEGSEFTRQIGHARISLAEDHAIEESPAGVGANDRVAMPVRRRPVANLCVQ